MSVAIPTTIEATTAAALSAMIPEARDVRVVGRVEWDDESNGIVRYFVAGTLPTGREYEVRMSRLDMKAVYRDSKGAWLDSIELARELQKAAQAFRVAIALEGNRNRVPPPPDIQLGPLTVDRPSNRISFRAYLPSDANILDMSITCNMAPRYRTTYRAQKCPNALDQWEVRLGDRGQHYITTLWASGPVSRYTCLVDIPFST